MDFDTTIAIIPLYPVPPGKISLNKNFCLSHFSIRNNRSNTLVTSIVLFTKKKLVCTVLYIKILHNMAMFFADLVFVIFICDLLKCKNATQHG